MKRENDMAVDYLKNLIPEKKCRKCGKKFVPAPMHIYKEGRDHTKWYCSWTCYNHRKDKEGTKK